MSAFSQNYANKQKGRMNLQHSNMKSGLTNGEGMALNQSPEAAIAMFYSEIKFYDFNNPVRIQSGPKVNGRLSKHLELLQWEPRKNQSFLLN